MCASPARKAALRAQTDAVTTALALDEVSHSAQLDALTGLPNRLLLLDRFALAIASAKRRGHRLALLFLDLDKFKQINGGWRAPGASIIVVRAGRAGRLVGAIVIVVAALSFFGLR